MSLLLTATRRLLVLRRRSTTDAATLRRVIARRGDAAPVTAAVRRVAHVSEKRIGDRRVVRLTPRRGGTGRHLIFTHGGCYTFPVLGLHWGLLARLIEASGVSVSVPLYGLAPEHTAASEYPFLEAVYRDALETYGQSIFLAGDSAGGGLALGQAQRYRDAGLAAPLGLLLVSPWVDVTMQNPGATAIAPLDHMLAPPGLAEAGRLWAGGVDPRDPSVSPLFGDLAGLPPTYIYQGDHDVLYPDAEELARRVARAGGTVELRITHGGFHDFPAVPWLPEARLAVRRMASVLRG